MIDQAPGPEAQAAAEQAVRGVSCMWAVPQSDSGFSVGLAQLPTDVRDELIAALQDSTDYTEEAGESGQMFSGEVPGGLGTINVVYIFDEDLWVLATGGSDIGPMKTLAWEVHKDRHTPRKGG